LNLRLTITIFLFLLSQGAYAQDSIVAITPDMANRYNYISLSDLNGWIFRQGTDPSWAKDSVNVTGWQHLKPKDITGRLADKSGRLEGWLRIKIILDSSFAGTPLDVSMSFWAAADLYIDGRLLYSYGNTGANGKPYREYSPWYKLPLPLNVEKGNVHLLALHIVDHLSPLPPFDLKSSRGFNSIIICLPAYKQGFFNWSRGNQTFKTIWMSVNVILCCLFWLLSSQNRGEKNIRLISITSTAVTITIATDNYVPFPGLSYFGLRMIEIAWTIFLSVSSILTVILLIRIFGRPATRLLKGLLALVALCAPLLIFYPNQWELIFEIFLVNAIYGYYIITSWKNLRGAQWAVLAGTLLMMMLGFALAFIANDNSSFVLIRLLYTGVFLSFPLSLLVYVSMRFKEIITDVRKNAAQVVLLSEEKKQQALNQQKILQDEVNRQTAELRDTLKNLKATQAQLVQSEKMASLGELTAGIAHEIQNPLNFVNNFSDVNSELADELKSELAAGNVRSAIEIAESIKDNEEKINHHGKRADAIVKGMLQHSRTSGGQRELTDINALVNENLRLSFHGLRAKDKSFNAKFETDLDPSVGKIEIVPHDLGRVILNLVNNAFYAVGEKQKENIAGYEPCVIVQTKKVNDKIEIRIKDNGKGISQKILEKIFQPFFTTKPTGQGTGLGLSLAYDIVKAHGGEVKVATKEGEGSEFRIYLPTSNIQ